MECTALLGLKLPSHFIPCFRFRLVQNLPQHIDIITNLRRPSLWVLTKCKTSLDQRLAGQTLTSITFTAKKYRMGPFCKAPWLESSHSADLDGGLERRPKDLPGFSDVIVPFKKLVATRLCSGSCSAYFVYLQAVGVVVFFLSVLYPRFFGTTCDRGRIRSLYTWLLSVYWAYILNVATLRAPEKS